MAAVGAAALFTGAFTDVFTGVFTDVFTGVFTAVFTGVFADATQPFSQLSHLANLATGAIEYMRKSHA